MIDLKWITVVSFVWNMLDFCTCYDKLGNSNRIWKAVILSKELYFIEVWKRFKKNDKSFKNVSMKYIALYFLSITIKNKTVWWRKNDKTTVLIRLLLKVLSYLISGTIGDKYDYIVQHRLDTSDILDRMITHLVISVKDRHCIEHNKSQDEQTKALLDVVTKTMYLLMYWQNVVTKNSQTI